MTTLTRLIRTSVAGLLGLVLAGCATHINEPERIPELAETDFQVREGVTYSPPRWPQALQADLYLPQVETPAPAVLMVHGGGWERRSREDMTWLAEALAGHGFMVMNIDYRFAPEFTFPAQLHDLQVAMGWLRDHAGELNLDPDRIGAFGFSSGAHLVALLATVASSDSELNEPHGGPHTRPGAVVAGGLPADLVAFGSGKLIRQFLGGNLEQMPETYRAASPITHVTANSPPFFLFHGGLDGLVPESQARNFRARLAEHGVENQLYIMHLRGHILSFASAGTVMDEAMAFLDQHLEGP
ncbi:MAG: alpha/beta hydrolase [Marinobacter sp.]|uniref:alpha/beta hydrolase n=1 Tax=Marinobacter sp. TaxID=50741 RepID=UPI00299D4DB7|nr:alpha/beta hydrolase [Marinobacter sp.]MDX1634167.1 alpha/beta hydrolase [Marinobacter sp.]